MALINDETLILSLSCSQSSSTLPADLMSWKKITRKTLQVYSRTYCFLFIVFLSIISLMQLLWFHAYTSIYFDKFTSNVDRFWCNLNDFVLLFKFKISLISSKGIIQNCVTEVDHVVHARKEWNYCLQDHDSFSRPILARKGPVRS